ncbi:hypothetical protein CEXT_11011 [Caerostris extrusa]|uniref:Uncharacterized protein n=1 Tax=Caerostris extrusa TaxID=172846 RepID=A0AAV4MCY3_CAEEX|nr:hypothetical protein CEXT_11011 [Caerostris extrusa]
MPQNFEGIFPRDDILGDELHPPIFFSYDNGGIFSVDIYPTINTERTFIPVLLIGFQIEFTQFGNLNSYHDYKCMFYKTCFVR